ncbi:MAG: RNA polymerase sigma factor [Clostridia bacterium]|nr:RNA polymerase sigma factor [Clostridia bacterium]
MASIKQMITDREGDRALRRLAAGDRSALGNIYDLYSRLILSVAYTIVENTADAEDVLQDTMIELVRYATRYGSGSSPRAYILTITRHIAIDTLRRRKPQTSLEEAGDRSSDDGLLEAVEVLDLLRILSEEERQAVTLHLYGGLSHKEVAKTLGITTAAAEKKYRRALAKLRQQYEC